MTLADQIRTLAVSKPDLTTRQIAEQVYGEATHTRIAYVRVVARQRVDGKETPSNRRWRDRNRERLAGQARERRARYRVGRQQGETHP